jgi:hypothetical protein
MTKEEAITVLKGLSDNPLFSNQHRAAFNIAIKALEHPEKNVVAVVPCGDCISRADAIHAVSEALERAFVEHEDIANTLIGKLPTVTSQDLNCQAEWSKNEYKQGWCDALSMALKEAHTIHSEEGIFQVVQAETLIGLGYAIDDPQESEDKE